MHFSLQRYLLSSSLLGDLQGRNHICFPINLYTQICYNGWGWPNSLVLISPPHKPYDLFWLARDRFTAALSIPPTCEYRCSNWVKNDSSAKQGKSVGFESCDRSIVRKRQIWVKIGDVLSRVTLKFDGWPSKTTGHLSFAVSSFVQHFIVIGEFKLELQSGNAQFG